MVADGRDDRSHRAGLPARAAQRDLASRHLQGVSSLYAVRADLRGVYAFADVVEEAVRWSA